MLALALMLVACTPQVGFPEKGLPLTRLYGAYEADYNIARERLVLNADRTFTQEVKLKTGKIARANGTWSYDPDDGYVTFHDNFMVVLDGFGRLAPDYSHPPKGDNVFPVLYHPFYMSIDSSEKVRYKKT